MRRIALKIAYDGSKFYGWQKQVQSPTVQEVLEFFLSKLAKEQIKVIGSGRTDTGVHATAQVAHFDFPLQMTKTQIILASKSYLPKAVQVLDVAEVSSEFNSRYDAIARTYNYIITKDQSPFNYYFKSYYPRYKIDAEIFKQCTQYFIGENDFTSFCKPNPEITNHICKISKLSIAENSKDIIITITGNRFLHNMVRRIVGAMISVSHKKLNPEIIIDWLAMKKHEQKNYFTATPNGLYLSEVRYPADVLKFSENTDFILS